MKSEIFSAESWVLLWWWKVHGHKQNRDKGNFRWYRCYVPAGWQAAATSLATPYYIVPSVPPTGAMHKVLHKPRCSRPVLYRVIRNRRNEPFGMEKGNSFLGRKDRYFKLETLGSVISARIFDRWNFQVRLSHTVIGCRII